MNPYFRASMICLAIAVIVLWVFLTVGCADKDNVEIMGVCRHEATYAISVFGEKYPVRVAVGDRQGVYHSQAQAWVGNDWRWLSVGSNFVVRICAKDETFTPKYYYVPWVWFAERMSRMVTENRPN